MKNTIEASSFWDSTFVQFFRLAVFLRIGLSFPRFIGDFFGNIVTSVPGWDLSVRQFYEIFIGGTLLFLAVIRVGKFNRVALT